MDRKHQTIEILTRDHTSNEERQQDNSHLNTGHITRDNRNRRARRRTQEYKTRQTKKTRKLCLKIPRQETLQ